MVRASIQDVNIPGVGDNQLVRPQGSRRRSINIVSYHHHRQPRVLVICQEDVIHSGQRCSKGHHGNTTRVVDSATTSAGQKPLAIVVIGGALALALLPRLLQPALLLLVHRGRTRKREPQIDMAPHVAA